MRRGIWTIAAAVGVLVLAALILSCGPRETSNNPGVASAPDEQPPARVSAPPPAESVVDAVEEAPDTSAAAAAPSDPPSRETPAPAPEPAPPPTSPPSHAKNPASLPRLVYLGADRCIPCKMMAPILAELAREYEGQLEVEFIDVWKKPLRAKTYGIKVIPTQIFFDASGVERFRHEGFFGKEDILKKWEELGVTLRPPQG